MNKQEFNNQYFKGLPVINFVTHGNNSPEKMCATMLERAKTENAAVKGVFYGKDPEHAEPYFITPDMNNESAYKAFCESKSRYLDAHIDEKSAEKFAKILNNVKDNFTVDKDYTMYWQQKQIMQPKIAETAMLLGGLIESASIQRAEQSGENGKSFITYEEAFANSSKVVTSQMTEHFPDYITESNLSAAKNLLLTVWTEAYKYADAMGIPEKDLDYLKNRKDNKTLANQLESVEITYQNSNKAYVKE